MLDVFLYTLNGVLPVFLIIFLGIPLARLGFFPEQVRDKLVSLVFYVGTPALIFRQLASSDLSAVASPRYLTFLLLIIPAEIALMWLLCFFIRDPKKKGAVLQISYRSNIAIVGLPLAEKLMSPEGVALTALSLSLTIIVYNVSAVVLLSYYGGTERRLAPVFLNVIKNPLIISVLLGTAASLLGLPMESGTFYFETLQTLGTTASSIGLLVIGASISFSGLRKDRLCILWSVLLRCFVSPAFIVGAAILFGFRGDALLALAILSATPAAVNCFVMAKKMGVSESISAFGISFTGIASLLSVFLSVFILKASGLA